MKSVKKKALIALALAALLLSSCAKKGNDKSLTDQTGDIRTDTSVTAAIEGTSDKMLGIKQFETKGSEGEAFSFTSSTRIMIDSASESEETIETATVCISLFNEKLGEGDQPLQLVIGNFSPSRSDIVLKINSGLVISGDPEINRQAYKIDIGEYATVEAPSSVGLYYGMMSLLQYTKAYDGIRYGTIIDHPDVEERCLHLDAARKYFSKAFIIDMIKEISYQKMNALELHFSENEGMRIQCDTDPSIVSAEYLTKDEIREIIDEAKRYKVEIIPSFDSPGHLKQLLSVHPEYRLTDTDGYVSEKTLDITNEKAVAYVRSLISEYAELFKDCKCFNIGGDECFGWSDVSRMRFSSWNVLKEYAVSKWGSKATAHDAFVNYINETAAFLEERGFKVRAWNDGLMRTNEGSGVVALSDTIDVCYWTDNGVLGAQSVQMFINNGNNLYNVNESYLYYVLKDGYEPASARDILSQWTPGIFPNDRYTSQRYKTPFADTLENKLKGAYYCIWCDQPETQTEAQVKEGSAERIAAMALRSWNAEGDVGYAKFKKQTSAIS